MADIQSATAEIRRGKKEDIKKKKPQGKNIMTALFHRAAMNSNVSSRCTDNMVNFGPL